MKRTVLLALLLSARIAPGQIPVIDAAGLAQAVATVAALRAQVRLLIEDVQLTRAIESGTDDINRTTRSHLDRYRRSLRKRGLVRSAPLGALLRSVERELEGEDAISYLGDDAQRVWLGHERAPDPIAYERDVLRREMGTMQHSLRSLAAHGRQLRAAHEELERFKREIASNPEPQQMRDVEASLQILTARETMLARQAVMTLTNLEAVRAAGELDRRAQKKVLYTTFVGSSDWLGDPGAYRFDRFMRMPGKR